MEEQSDTPRTNAVQYQWTRTLDLARVLERELAAATRERDAAITERDENEGVFKVWRRRCEENDAEIVKLKRERDEALAEGERLRSALQRLACLGNGDRPGNSEGNVIALEALAATEPKP